MEKMNLSSNFEKQNETHKKPNFRERECPEQKSKDTGMDIV